MQAFYLLIQAYNMLTVVATYSKKPAAYALNCIYVIASFVGFRFVNHNLQYAFLKSSKDFIN